MSALLAGTAAVTKLSVKKVLDSVRKYNDKCVSRGECHADLWDKESTSEYHMHAKRHGMTGCL